MIGENALEFRQRIGGFSPLTTVLLARVLLVRFGILIELKHSAVVRYELLYLFVSISTPISLLKYEWVIVNTAYDLPNIFQSDLPAYFINSYHSGLHWKYFIFFWYREIVTDTCYWSSEKWSETKRNFPESAFILFCDVKHSRISQETGISAHGFFGPDFRPSPKFRWFFGPGRKSERNFGPNLNLIN